MPIKAEAIVIPDMSWIPLANTVANPGFWGEARFSICLIAFRSV